MITDRLVLAVGDENKRGRRGHATTQHAQHVERRLVSPVHILEDDHRRLTQLLQQRQRQLAWMPARLDGRRKHSADLRRDVHERPERRRCDQAFAGSEQDALLDSRGERLHKRRLAHAGVTTDEQDPAALTASVLQPRQERLPLDQL